MGPLDFADCCERDDRRLIWVFVLLWKTASKKQGEVSYESQSIGKTQMRILPDRQTQRHDPGHLFPRRAPQAASGLKRLNGNIIGVDIPGNKRVEFSLRYLYGVGPAKALEIIQKVGIDPDLKAKDLTPDQIGAITKILQDDLLVEGDLRRTLAADIRRLQQINCYRGIRHRRSLPVRGQRTKTNARTRKGKKVTIGAIRDKTQRRLAKA